MHWYLIHTKPRQESCALINLEQQGYQCYLPTLRSEKMRQGALVLADEPLFPRYLFIRLGLEESDKSWAPIRSTRGVSKLVSFGARPARIDDCLIDLLKSQEKAMQCSPELLFKPGERVCLVEGPFAGLEGIYQIAEGERRVMVLIELLSKPITIGITPNILRKVAKSDGRLY